MRSRKVKRDRSGRWQPGTRSPNPKGRPKRKKPARPFDPADIRDFMNQQVIMKDGTPKFRNELLLLKIFEDAMKGRVTNQRYLQQRYDEAVTATARLSFEYRQLLSIWVIDNERLADLHYKVPAKELQQMKRWHILLHQQDPERYPIDMSPDRLIEFFREQRWVERKRRADAEATANASADAAKKTG